MYIELKNANELWINGRSYIRLSDANNSYLSPGQVLTLIMMIRASIDSFDLRKIIEGSENPYKYALGELYNQNSRNRQLIEDILEDKELKEAIKYCHRCEKCIRNIEIQDSFRLSKKKRLDQKKRRRKILLLL